MDNQEDTFTALCLKKAVLDGLEKAGFKTPSPIQKKVIPLILSGRDVIGHAQTGTGKTAAFALPALDKLEQKKEVQVLVITPTRELASQVKEEISRLGQFVKVQATTIYGGSSFTRQIDSVKRGAQVVVATPGRLLDLLQGKRLGTFAPSLVIIDEADEMLDMGFLEDLQAIFDFLPEERQTLMFSATMPKPIEVLAKKVLKDPASVKITSAQTTNENIEQRFCVLQESDKDQAVMRLFVAEKPHKAVIFCKTKKDVDRLAQFLAHKGQRARGLHGDIEQGQRETITESFRRGSCNVLVATDVAARGLNIPDTTHVINYHLPFDAESYVHRIGRTGRAGRQGISITLVTPKERHVIPRFEKRLGATLKKCEIPTKKELETIQLKRVLSEMEDQSIANDALSFVQKMEANGGDLPSFASSLLSYVLAQHKVEGPESLGVSGGAYKPKQDSRDRRGGKRPYFSKKRSFHPAQRRQARKSR